MVFWKQNKNFWKYLSIAVLPCSTSAEAFANETRIIMETKAALNAPWACKSKHGVPSWSATRMFTKKKYLFRGRNNFTPAVTRAFRRRVGPNTSTEGLQMLEALHWLAAKERPTYSVQQILRHHLVTKVELLRMAKLVRCIEQPKRSKLAREITEAMKWKGGHIPHSPSALKIPQLNTPDFAKSLHSLLKTTRQLSLGHCLPCHAPPVSVITSAWPSIQNTLWNHLSPPDPQLCQCDILGQNVPEECRSPDGHIILWGHHLANFAKVDKMATICSSKEAVFPSKMQWFRQVEKSWTKYLDRNMIDHAIRPQITKEVEAWATQQWESHNGTSTHSKSNAVRDLQKLASTMVFHCEDHKATRLVAYCPALYKRLCDETFADPNIWRKENLTVKEAIKHLKKLLPRGTAR